LFNLISKVDNSKKIIFTLVVYLLSVIIKNLLGVGELDCGYAIKMDLLSFRIIILTLIITILIVSSRYRVIKFNENYLLFQFLLIQLALILITTFSISSTLGFYFFFEASLFPTLIVVMGWGYQPERLQAGVYFLFYTISSSLPLLLLLIYVGAINGSMDLRIIYLFIWPSITVTFIRGFILIIAFLVKLPIFIVHLWLPKAHVEAPVAGSIILAGVLLKLGGYGIIIIFPLIYFFIKFTGSLYLGLSLAGIIFVGFVCIRLNDFKALVAYSSVAHIGIVICGLVRFYIWGLIGAILIIISHGLSSSGLFRIVNIYYERLGRRRFYINRGLLILFPVFTLMIFILAAANIAAPPTLNLLSEILLIVSILGYDYYILIVFPLGSFLGAVFTLFIYSYSQHGKIYNLIYGIEGGRFREIHILLLHILPINVLILSPAYFLGVL